MNDSSSPLASTPSNPVTLEALAAAHQSLRTAFHVTLVMLFILTGSLSVFFLREISIARKQMTELTKVLTEYERSAVPLMEDFRTKLQAFSRAHPDFTPIYVRYFGSTSAPPLTQGGPAQAATNLNIPRLPPNR